MNEDQMKELILELEAYQHRGAIISLSGFETTPAYVARAIQVNEEGCYMRDYVTDSEGKLKEIRFDKVRE